MKVDLTEKEITFITDAINALSISGKMSDRQAFREILDSADILMEKLSPPKK